MDMIALKVVAALIALILGMLSQMDTDEEIKLVEKAVAVAATRPRVFAYLADMRNYKLWYPKVTSFEPIDVAPVSIGKHYQQIYDYTLYGEVTYTSVITGYESPTYISFMTDDWTQSRVEIVVERRAESGAGFPSLVTFKLYTGRRSYLMKYLLRPLLSLMYSSVSRQALLNLRYAFQS